MPFAQWLVQEQRPRLVLSLAPGRDELHSALWRAVQPLGPGADCLWIGTPGQGSRREDRGTGGPDLERGSPRRTEREASLAPQFDAATALSRIDAGSVDLLHVAGPFACRWIEEDLPRWLALMSESGIVLLTGVSPDEPDQAARRMFAGLGRDHATFEFPHDGGLGVVAIGREQRDEIARLFEAAAVPEVGDRLRGVYRRLGQGVRDSLERKSLEISSARLVAELEELAGINDQVARLREQNATLMEQALSVEEQRLDLASDVKGLGLENRELKAQLLQQAQSLHRLDQELNQIQQSLGWTALQKARRLRRTLIRDGGVSGRVWRRGVRLMRKLLRSNYRGAARRAVSRLRRAIGLRPLASQDHARSPLAHLGSNRAPGLRFEDLDWTYSGEDCLGKSGQLRPHKLILISHSACRTGAPHCLLRLAQELSQLPHLECWIVLQKEGELREEFSRIAPTLEMDRLVERGIPTAEVPGVIASLFREYTSRGLAICNTMAVSEFHGAFHEEGIPVLSWVHELPTMVHLNGGSAAVEKVRAASRKIIVPAEIVRHAWSEKFAIESEKLLMSRYGVDTRSNGIDRVRARKLVRQELGIPEDGLIVLACGTVDMRKGADLFVQVARKYFNQQSATGEASRTWFVWIGDRSPGAFQNWLEHDAQIGESPGRVVFAGEKSDTTPYFLASDLFLLTSREDPCPFANLEAMESGVPVIVFKGAGGAPEVIGGGGIAVPYLDVDAMADAVAELCADSGKRSEMGRMGREIIRRDFTWKGFMGRFLDVLRESYGLFPPASLRVSVVVPNYRHAPYLEERLRSIFRQTVLPHEIVILDDASPDESVPTIERLMVESPVPIRLIVNDANSGSTFRQWVKGLEESTGDLIWMAESDDSCHPQFLERLLPAFNNPDVTLAYCQSELIGADGIQIEPHFLGHTDDLSSDRWRSPYCVEGVEEIEVALSQKNTIPNASAMVFRRPRQLEFLDQLFGLRFAGDWLFHAMLCRSGKISYSPDVLNRYRRHEQTVSHRAVQRETYLSETVHVKRLIFEASRVSPRAMASSLAQTVFEYHRLNPGQESCPVSRCPDPLVQGEFAKIRHLLEDRCTPSTSLRVLLLLDELAPELTCLSIVDLANALAEDHLVFVASARPESCDPQVVARFDRRVLFIEGTPGVPDWLLATLNRKGWNDSDVRIRLLEELSRLHAIDVIDSRARHADRLARRLNERLGLPWFAQDRGAESDVSAVPDSDDGVALDATRCHRGQRAEGPHLLPAEFGLAPEFCERLLERRVQPGDEFVVSLADGNDVPAWMAKSIDMAKRVINRMPAADRGHKRLRVLTTRTEPWAARLPAPLAPLARLAARTGPSLAEAWLADLVQCDAIPLPDLRSVSRRSLATTCLGLRIPVITGQTDDASGLLCDGTKRAGWLIPPGPTSRFDLDALIEALLNYMRNPAILEAHRQAAGTIFMARFASQRAASRCSAAYLTHCDPPSDGRTAGSPHFGRGKRQSPRQSA